MCNFPAALVAYKLEKRRDKKERSPRKGLELGAPTQFNTLQFLTKNQVFHEAR
jgi:hypothetical protein